MSLYKSTMAKVSTSVDYTDESHFSLCLDVLFACDCFQTFMPFEWSAGSTVFALDYFLQKFRLLPCEPLSCMKVFS